MNGYSRGTNHYVALKASICSNPVSSFSTYISDVLFFQPFFFLIPRLSFKVLICSFTFSVFFFLYFFSPIYSLPLSFSFSYLIFFFFFSFLLVFHFLSFEFVSHLLLFLINLFFSLFFYYSLSTPPLLSPHLFCLRQLLSLDFKC